MNEDMDLLNFSSFTMMAAVSAFPLHPRPFLVSAATS
jgi:hypothetical protein